MQADMLLHIIKLVLGGIAAFLAIILWSKTRDAAWMALVAGTVTSYAGIVYGVLSACGIGVFQDGANIKIAGIALVPLLFSVVPQLFYIGTFAIMLTRKRF